MSQGNPSVQEPNQWLIRGLGIGLVALVLLVFWPALDADFVDFDDDYYVTEAPWLDGGLNAENLFAAFTETRASHWHPLTVISHMVDGEIYGLDPRGHHLTSVLFHAANALLVFLLLHALTGAPWRSALVAALFAVHPLRVESVAWISERKDVLSTFFALLTLFAYRRYVERRDNGQPAIGAYGLVALLFLLGLVSKAMLVTLPCVLLLLDVWPLRRLRLFGDERSNLRDAVRLGSEKLPLLGLSATFAIATVVTHDSALSVRVEASTGLRIANALDGWTAYLLDTFWPAGLAIYYPFPESIPPWQTAASLLALVAITALVLARLRRSPELAVGWSWYVGTLVPVIGLLHVGHQARADRYTYLPSIGLGIALVWGLAELWQALRKRFPWASGSAATPALGVVLGVVLGAVLLALGLATRAQIGHWMDSERLWTRAIAVTQDNYLAHLNLAEVLRAEGRREEAEAHYRAVPELRPELAVGHAALGDALRAWGEPEAAIEHLEKAIDIDPSDVRFYFGLVASFEALGQEDEADAALRSALEAGADDPALRLLIARRAEQRGELDDAIGHLRAALEQVPERPDLRLRLARVLDRAGRLDEAADELVRILERWPGALPAHHHLGSIRQRQGDWLAARDHLGTAFAGDPSPELARALAAVLLELGDRTRAEQVLRVAAERFPGAEKLGAGEPSPGQPEAGEPDAGKPEAGETSPGEPDTREPDDDPASDDDGV